MQMGAIIMDMQQTYIIAFESSSKVNEIVATIKSGGYWAKITSRTWAIVSKKTATQIRDEIIAVAGPNDKIFVVRSGVAAAWRDTYASNEWLKKNL
jgi:hypothetical protein